MRVKINSCGTVPFDRGAELRDDNSFLGRRLLIFLPAFLQANDLSIPVWSNSINRSASAHGRIFPGLPLRLCVSGRGQNALDGRQQQPHGLPGMVRDFRRRPQRLNAALQVEFRQNRLFQFGGDGFRIFRSQHIIDA